MIGCDVRNRGS